ncbi:MAG: transporter [Candidatus Aminicenantes bacterium RBG_16_63_16]|nr:MAG: transporter [Candidatus Aminicenantes bacterium RBG_16_63_16]
MNKRIAHFCLILAMGGGFSSLAGHPTASPAKAEPLALTAGEPQSPRAYSLQECLEVALQNNRWRPASQFAVEVAEAQHKQALSSYWPSLSLRSSFMKMDEDSNFLFPAQSLTLNAPFLPMPLPITIPEMDVRLMDDTTLFNSLSLSLPIYTGGLREAIIKQAKNGIEAARQAARRTDLKVIFDVKRLYYASVLSQNLAQVGRDALARLDATLSLTENLYQKGSGRVKKTDYLRNKTIVEAARSLLAVLESNVQLAKAALVNSMGLPWETAIELSEKEIPYEAYPLDLKDLVNSSYSFNPDWAALRAGLQAAEARVSEAKSGYLPKLGLMGSLNIISNTYDKGMMTPTNKTNWMAGIGLEIPIFNGFLTTHEVQEARARLRKMEQEQILLKEGLALQVQDVFLQVIRAQKQHDASKSAMEAAGQNRDLNVRAYQDELVETQEVIEAQLMESFMQAQFQKVLFDHLESRFRLDLIVGEEVQKLVK